jgi:hypothetical protein
MDKCLLKVKVGKDVLKGGFIAKKLTKVCIRIKF